MADVCPFKDKECFNCRKIGHTRRKCKGGEQRKELKQLVVKEEELEGAAAMNYDMSFLDLYPLKTDNSNAVILHLKLNGVDCRMEIDTGAALSVISTEKYKLIKKSGENLVSTNTCLKNLYRRNCETCWSSKSSCRVSQNKSTTLMWQSYVETHPL